MTCISRRRFHWLAETAVGLAAFLAVSTAPQIVHATIAPFHYTPHRVELPLGPNLFGSVAIGIGHAPQQERWRQVMHEGLDGPGPWRAILDEVRGMAPDEGIRAINTWVNHRIQFASDREVYGVEDYWASATESLSRGRGDCEDTAIAKLDLLREAGLPASDLYLVLVQDLVARQAHALAVVRVDGGWVVLDNRTDEIQPAEAASDYRPILTLGEDAVWLHGFAVAAGRPATPAL
jgi:predicted transglutaminase-like cysteine proteinase